METIIQRAQSPTPTFFKKLRNIALILTGISGVILTAPVSLPAAIVSGAGYLAVAGGIAATVSQLTTEPKPVKPVADSTAITVKKKRKLK